MAHPLGEFSRIGQLQTSRSQDDIATPPHLLQGAVDVNGRQAEGIGKGVLRQRPCKAALAHQAAQRQTVAQFQHEIRDPFLRDAKEHGFVVVHGHTIVAQVEERPNRIAIDTGAYHSGILTALAVEDEKRWFLTGAENEEAEQRVRSEAA